MANIKIYTKDYCPYCKRAKMLFDNLNQEYEEYNVEKKEDFDNLFKKTNFMTVPQIFIGNEFIGGFDDLNKLYKLGKLNEMLK